MYIGRVNSMKDMELSILAQSANGVLVEIHSRLYAIVTGASLDAEISGQRRSQKIFSGDKEVRNKLRSSFCRV